MHRRRFLPSASGITRWKRPRASSSSVETARWMPQQALGRHHDQRLAPRAQHLPAQQWKYCAGVVGLHDLDVVLGGEREEALEAGAGVLGPLPFEAVRQQQHEAAQAAPLVLGAGDELVDDHLRRVDEVAELRFPQHEPSGQSRL